MKRGLGVNEGAIWSRPVVLAPAVFSRAACVLVAFALAALTWVGDLRAQEDSLQAQVDSGEVEGVALEGVVFEGEVLDLRTGLPVLGAIVALPSLARSVMTDELGYFRMEGVPAGFYEISVIRLGYEGLLEELPVNGREIVAVHLTPGPIPLEGIEVEVISRAAQEMRAMGISSRSIVGPVEMESLRESYFSLDQLLTSRTLPRARYHPAMGVGGRGCLRVSRPSLRGGSCAALVVDGVLVNPEAADWVYRLSPNDIFAMRFLYGPAAAIRYGHRGSDGVLFIETRVGR